MFHLRTVRLRARCALVSLACISLFGTASAQSFHEPAPDPVVITVTRLAQPRQSVVADVTVLDRDQIVQSGAVNLADLLQRQHGIELSRTGGPGTQTSLFVRGADNRFTAVFIDGVRVDSQATGGAPWDGISLAQVDRIEIVRGPAAAVYGSDAVAGVIQIFTRQATGSFTPYVGVGVGTLRSWNTEAGFTGTSGIVDYALGVAREGSRGFNIMPASNPDKDGYRQTSASARLGLEFNPDARIELSGSWNHTRARYDSDPAFDPPAVGRDDYGLNRLSTLGGTWTQRWGPHYTTRLVVGESNYRYESVTPPTVYRAKTRVRNYLVQNEWKAGGHTWSANLERREDHLVTTPVDRGRYQNAIALGYGYSDGTHTVQINLRHDRDSEFGGQTNGSVAYGYAFAPNWRVTASAATAFRAPTLFQTNFGVGGLGPEESRNLEVGLHWGRERSGFDLVVYRSRIQNLIDWDMLTPCAVPFWGGCYVNTGRADLRGASVSARHGFGPVNLGVALDWQQPVNAATGKLLQRRARHQLRWTIDTRVAGWTLGGEWLVASHRWEDAANTIRLAGYGIVNLYAQTTVHKDWDLLLRLDNLTNRKWQLASGYEMQPRRLFVGLRWTPR